MLSSWRVVASLAEPWWEAVDIAEVSMGVAVESRTCCRRGQNFVLWL